MPSLTIDTFSFGPLTVHIWGLFVSAGFAAGIALAFFRARRRGVENPERILDLALWILVGSLFGARIFHVFLYEPTFYLSAPLEMLKFWEGGMSSFGGFFGAFFGGWWYIKRHALDFLTWADAAVFGLPVGLAIGRIGCFLTHMHPGIKSNFFLAVPMQDGLRLELGLIEALLASGILILFFALDRKPRSGGFFLTLFLVVYAPARFLMDFLRATDLVVADVRYFGLTPAQYGSLLFLSAGVYLFSAHILKKQA